MVAVKHTHAVIATSATFVAVHLYSVADYITSIEVAPNAIYVARELSVAVNFYVITCIFFIKCNSARRFGARYVTIWIYERANT